ncbi:hypothetical protein DXG01_001200 [Tephrocybe rancida]|nr:hypothetical protein DXG01_001200 [Tephrocybe rancida]
MILPLILNADLFQTAFHHKFLGLSTGTPHCKPAHNIWHCSQDDKVKAEFMWMTRPIKVTKTNWLAFYNATASKLFNTLPGEDKLFWESKAWEEFEADTKAWKDAWSAPPPTDPALRQCTIEQTPNFATPFLNTLGDTTGWKWLLIGGGPEPADSSRLNIMISDIGAYSVTNNTSPSVGAPSTTNSSVSTGKYACTEPSNNDHSPKHQLIDTVSAPTNAPVWFKSVLKKIQTEDLGPQWTKLPLGWADIEAKALFANAAPLLPSGCPACVGDWIQCACSFKWHPTVDVNTFKDSFKAWFEVICPVAHCSGKNSFLSVLTALFFWVHGLLEEDSNGASWDKVVANVSELFLA